MDGKKAVELVLGVSEEIVEASLPQHNSTEKKILRMGELKIRQSILQFKTFDTDTTKPDADRFLLPLSDMGPE